MKLTIAFAFLAVVQAVPVFDNSLKYAGVKVFRVPTGSNPDGIKALVEKFDLDTWTHSYKADSHIDVQVPKEQVKDFVKEAKTLLAKQRIAHPIVTMHEDLGASIKVEADSMKQPSEVDALAGLATDAWFNAYHSYADHLTFLNDLQATFPSNSRIVTTGTSIGGRAITGINIFGSSGSGTKPAVIWHGTVHAREWISSMVNEYLAYNLLNNYANDTAVRSYVDKYDFYIFPIVNPDGFLYSQTNDRMWRKNRKAAPSGSTCLGVDVNRNWNVQWSQTGGASTSPCAQDYKGTAAASEPETQGLQNFLNARANSAAGAKMYTDWHSYSQLFMSPYGYSCSKQASNSATLNSLTSGFASAVRAVSGTGFTTGPICNTIYQVSGGSTDYAYDVSRIPYSFAAELRDTGAFGFVLPANQIRPSGAEIWAGVKYLLANIV